VEGPVTRSSLTWSALRAALFLAALPGALRAQSAPRPVYVESFRQLSTKIETTAFEVNLDAKNPSYQRAIKDADGKERFKLSFAPIRVGPGDERLLSWRVTLVDTRHPVYGDLLLPSRNPDLNEGAAAHAERLDANPYAQVPLTAERVIKVDQFYCVLKVQNYHLLVPERSDLDSMTVQVKFANKNPLSTNGNN
jgi:hypothetical protein